MELSRIPLQTLLGTGPECGAVNLFTLQEGSVTILFNCSSKSFHLSNTFTYGYTKFNNVIKCVCKF